MQVNSKLIFDVGANTGSFSSLYCDDYSVIAIEANPVLAVRLKQNPKFITESCAVSSYCGSVPFHLCAEDQMSSCNKAWLTEMRYRDKGIQETIDVPCVTLDTLIEKHGLPYHIKVDTEGYELEVLSGLSHKINSIQFEYIAEEFCNLTHPIIHRLRELGYTKYAIKDLCGDFVPNSYEQYTRTNTYSTADEILAMNGYGLMSGMILAF